MIDLLDAIVLTIKAANNQISGRTAIQKLLYFESMAGVIEAKYRPYYYGPYSSELMGTIESAVKLNFIDENLDVFNGKMDADSVEWKRYVYSLTEDGKELAEQLIKEHEPDYEKINCIVNTCKKISDLDVNTLSYAAKIHYILSSKKKPMMINEITEMASSFGWKLSKPKVEKAIGLLQALNLCT
ncbi:hypothetical protein [Methanocella conradii]|uniref:hypothetical protein n=1 Tax=Methanocella conradii TaxID=1175444 RepID=UPI0024B384F0|nr:hypothetical protein [Methanocella conradii]MDI6897477.1 hypothetical protein [Methanocella conradii]